MSPFELNDVRHKKCVPTLYYGMCHCPSLTGSSSSGDIDILLGHPDYTSSCSSKPEYIKEVVAELEREQFVTDTLSKGDSKFMVSVCMWCSEIHNRAICNEDGM